MAELIKKWIVALSMVAMVGGGFSAIVVPNTSLATTAGCTTSFLGFPAWYRGLTDPDCNIKSPTDVGGLSPFIWLIVLNCLDIALMAVVYLSGMYMLYGGFLFIISRGNPENAARARKTMLNAGIGLIISIVSVSVITFVASNIK